MELQAGDLLFYYGDHKVGSKVVGWLQEKFNQIGDAKELYTHVSMVSNYEDVLVEMKAPEPRFRKIDGVKRDFHVYRPQCDEYTKNKAIRWCYLHMGANYRFVHYIYGYFGWKTATKICSGWLNTGYTHAGFPLIENDKLVSPCELSVSKKLAFIG